MLAEYQTMDEVRKPNNNYFYYEFVMFSASDLQTTDKPNGLGLGCGGWMQTRLHGVPNIIPESLRVMNLLNS